jgi:hypothetical protein
MADLLVVTVILPLWIFFAAAAWKAIARDGSPDQFNTARGAIFAYWAGETTRGARGARHVYPRRGHARA